MSNTYIASLPWYDSEATQGPLDEFWRVAAQSLSDSGLEGVARTLARDHSLLSLWQSPNLLLSQCCGPDLSTALGADLCVIARPVFADLDCTPGCYYSYIVSRTEQPARLARIAVNSLTSRSGYGALTQWMDSNGIEVSAVHVSGSHSRSLTMLEHGLADLAAIDAHTMNLPGLTMRLPVIGRSAEALAPPYVCHQSSSHCGDLVVKALTSAVTNKGRDTGITEIIRSDRALYEEYFAIEANSGGTVETHVKKNTA